MKILYTEPSDSINKALKKIKKSGVRCLIVARKKKFLGILSDGDIRNNISQLKKTSKVENFYNKNAKYLLEKNYNKQKLENLLIKKVLDLVPICNESMIIKKVILRSNYIKNPEAYWKKKK